MDRLYLNQMAVIFLVTSLTIDESRSTITLLKIFGYRGKDVLMGFVLICLVYEITKFLCGRKLAKISISEALKAGTE
jgi:putative ABC transport system permease protein